MLLNTQLPQPTAERTRRQKSGRGNFCDGMRCGDGGCLDMPPHYLGCFCIDQGRDQTMWSRPDSNLRCSHTTLYPAVSKHVTDLFVLPNINELQSHQPKATAPIRATTVSSPGRTIKVTRTGLQSTDQTAPRAHGAAEGLLSMQLLGGTGTIAFLLLVIGLAVVYFLRRKRVQVLATSLSGAKQEGQQLVNVNELEALSAEYYRSGSEPSAVTCCTPGRRPGSYRTPRSAESYRTPGSAEIYSTSRSGKGYRTPVLLLAVIMESVQARRFTREDIDLGAQIGEGAFGTVFKGTISATLDLDGLQGRVSVAVKVLKNGALAEIRESFKREVEMVAAFDQTNILRLLGIIIYDEAAPGMVFEFMEFGDLTELLRRNDPSWSGRPKMVLKHEQLSVMACQISSGMAYLSSQHFVHRDLATRNCLVGADVIVKISDFGMSRDIYTCDYYTVGGRRPLPLRWMSRESFQYGRFTTSSDVWAFGVLLWEIYTYGKQPYYGFSNEEVMRFLEGGVLLSQPFNCPSAIYDVMLGCWSKEPRDRLAFEAIHELVMRHINTSKLATRC